MTHAEQTVTTELDTCGRYVSTRQTSGWLTVRVTTREPKPTREERRTDR